jgi:hypothetical protein
MLRWHERSYPATGKVPAVEIPILINRKKYEASVDSMTGRQILALAGFGEDHDLFALHGEGDSSGGTPIGLDQQVDVKAGNHFRAIPGNRNFGDGS